MKQTACAPCCTTSCATACIRRSEYGSPVALTSTPTVLMGSRWRFYSSRLQGESLLQAELLPMHLPTVRAAPLHDALAVPIRSAREAPAVAGADERVVGLGLRR